MSTIGNYYVIAIETLGIICIATWAWIMGSRILQRSRLVRVGKMKSIEKEYSIFRFRGWVIRLLPFVGIVVMLMSWLMAFKFESLIGVHPGDIVVGINYAFIATVFAVSAMWEREEEKIKQTITLEAIKLTVENNQVE